MKRAVPLRHADRCDCDECARLDLEFPGEGVQLAMPLAAPGQPARRRRRLADIEAEAFRKVPGL